MIAYLDTSAFGHIYSKTGCSGADIAQLRKAIYGRALSIRLSLHTLEEILLVPKASPQALAAQTKLTLSLANSRTLIKPCAQLLRDDVQAYVIRGEADRPFLRGDMQNAVSAGIAALIESDGEELEDEFIEVLQESRQQKQAFLALLERISKAAPFNSDAASNRSFEQYFEQAAASALELVADYAGAGAACRRRGLNGLLQIKSVQMSLLSALRSSNNPPYPTPPGSIHHAVSAAAVAAIFVCEDAPTRQLHSLSNDLEIITLSELLKRVSEDYAM